MFVAAAFVPRFLARHSAHRTFAVAAVEVAASKLNLNFTLPNETIYANTAVASVILPGVEGEYGITPDHVPYVAQLKPGVVQILFDDQLQNAEPEKYFVAGGYALTHANNTTVCTTVCVCVYCIVYYIMIILAVLIAPNTHAFFLS
jgi:hypothetical protein